MICKALEEIKKENPGWENLLDREDKIPKAIFEHLFSCPICLGIMDIMEKELRTKEGK